MDAHESFHAWDPRIGLAGNLEGLGNRRPFKVNIEFSAVRGQASARLCARTPLPETLHELLRRQVERVFLLVQLFVGPVPPSDPLHGLGKGRFETALNDLGRRAADHGIGFDIPGHNAAGGDDRAVADRHAGHDHRAHADPYVVSNSDRPVRFQILEERLRLEAPVLEMEGRGCVHRVVALTHENHAWCNGTECTDGNRRPFRAIVEGLAGQAVCAPAYPGMPGY